MVFDRLALLGLGSIVTGLRVNLGKLGTMS
jgi:hypothetical protein